jgi:hypothetical protein
MRESRSYGSVRGALSNERPYRESIDTVRSHQPSSAVRSSSSTRTEAAPECASESGNRRKFRICRRGEEARISELQDKLRLNEHHWLFPETGRFSKKNREAIKHEPGNH